MCQSIGIATNEKNPLIDMIRDSISSGTFSATVRYHARPIRLIPAPAATNAAASSQESVSADRTARPSLTAWRMTSGSAAPAML